MAMKRKWDPDFTASSTTPRQQNKSDLDEAVYSPSSRKRVRTRILRHVATSNLAYPRSAYNGYLPQDAPISEASALQMLRRSNVSNVSEDSYFQLNDFTIYHPIRKGHTGELASLDCLQVRQGCDELVFDGTVTLDGQHLYLQGVHFRTLAIDGYGDGQAFGVDDKLCVQTPQAAAKNIWYRLGTPSSIYRRFYSPFQWLATFAHHFVNYLLVTKDVLLADFRTDFFTSLDPRHRREEAYRLWHLECNNNTDFRTTVVANIEFLRKECYSIDDPDTGLCNHPLWDSAWDLRGIEERPASEVSTIVTPFVYRCFRDMYFGKNLQVRNVLNRDVLGQLQTHKERLGLTPFGARSRLATNMNIPQSQQDAELELDIAAGDVVTVNVELGSEWRVQSSLAYAYVQAVRPTLDRTVLDVLWLYAPNETTLGNAVYPFDNELFLSDHCECGKDAIDITSVASKVDIKWFVEDPSSIDGLCVRQRFRTKHEEDTYDFVSLVQSDFRCGCGDALSDFENCRRDFQVGDAVLVKGFEPSTRNVILEPAQILDFLLHSETVLLRRLLRRRTQSQSQQVRPNELLLTEEVYNGPARRVVRKINIRIFQPDVVANDLPTPYDRNGVGDFYFISSTSPSQGGVDGNGVDQADVDNDNESTGTGYSTFPPIRQCPSPVDLQSEHKLKGMGIFCGGGNFDRGLSDGGVIDFKYAVDYDQQAIYSYAANLKENDNTKLFFGSVNDYLAQAISGSEDETVACPGSIHFCSGGSPCPGFSNLQRDKHSEQSLRNCSLVASYVSFVDFFCPAYCILENVASMTYGHGPDKQENVFSQVLAALVGMGYQTQQFLMDAWPHGSSQARTRVFIVATAPGLKPLSHPPQTHEHPRNTIFMSRSLGRSSNGRTFGERREFYAPFQHVSPSEATADLPDIVESLPQLCPAYPDHKLVTVDPSWIRSRYAAIPKSPTGMGLVQAAKRGRLHGEPLDYYKKRGEKHGKAYSRIKADGLIPTVITQISPWCCRTGNCLHWAQDRPLTIMEMRRAQGILDHEVIIGTPADKVRIVGNSVERNVALVLGLAIRESWETSTDEARHRVLQYADDDNDIDDEENIKTDRRDSEADERRLSLVAGKRKIQLETPSDSEGRETPNAS